MDFETIREHIKREIPCMRYLHKAKKSGICCPFCKSGTGPNGTGAVVYYQGDNTFYCHNCRTGGDVIDAYILDNNQDPKDGKTHREAVIELGKSIGLYLDDDKNDVKQTDKKGLQRMKDNARKEPETPAEDPDGWEDIQFTWDDDKPAEENAGKSDLNGAGSDLKESGDNLPAGEKEPVKSESEAPKSNIRNLYKEDCLKWAANIGKTDYLTRQGIPVEIQQRFKIGYIPETNQIVFPYSKDYSYWEKRTANKSDKQYRKPKAEEAGPEPLYNLPALYTGIPVFICEGAIDVLSFATVGAKACAIMGAGTDKLIEKCKTKPPAAPLILWLDNDLPHPKTGIREGQATQKKLADGLTEAGIPYIEATYNLDLYGLDHGDPNDLLQVSAEQFRGDVEENLRRARQLQELGPEIGQFMETIYTDRFRPVPTGITGLDDFLHGGLIRQTLVLLGAEPGAGKTILATMIFESMARQGIPTLYFNFEMSKDQLLARSLARIMYTDPEISYKTSAVEILQGYKHDTKMREKVEAAARKYAAEIAPFVKYNPIEGADLDDVLKCMDNAGAEAVKAGKPAPCVCIDYLHILTSTVEKDAGEIIKRAVQKFKEFAEKYNTIVLVISAQSRKANASGKATLSAGRDTSAIEYSGDLVLQLIGNDKVDKKNGSPDEITLYITKSRFTAFDINEGLHFIKHGGQSYLEQQGTWQYVAGDEDEEENPFNNDDEKPKGKYKFGKPDDTQTRRKI